MKIKDNRYSKIQCMIEDFSDMLENDFDKADAVIRQLRKDETLTSYGMMQFEKLYQEHLVAHTEQNNEDYLTRHYMHA